MERFTFLLDAPSGLSGELQIAKLGDNFKDPRYGEFKITKNDVETWQKNLSHLPGGIALIDEDHLSNKPSPHRKTEADGWISSIYLDGDIPKAKVEWTPKGESAIKDKRYRFFSPSYGPFEKEDGTVIPNVFQGGGLTNKPKLNMATINLSSADDSEVTNNEVIVSLDSMYELGIVNLDISDEMRMKHATIVKEIGGKMVHMFPLPPGDKEVARAALRLLPHSEKAGNVTADEAAKVRKKANSILGKELMDSPRQMEITADTLTSLGIKDEATQKVILDLAASDGADALKVLEAIDAAKPKPEPVVDPNATKNLEQEASAQGLVLLDSEKVQALIENATAGAEAKKELEQNTFDTAFDRAVSKGKAVPAQKDFYKESYDMNKDSTMKALDDAPTILNVERKGSSENIEGAPDGIHGPAYELDQAVSKYIAENKLDPSKDYQTALEAVAGV